MSRGEFVFQLLSEHDVQGDLGLSTDQIVAVAAVRQKDFRTIPIVTNILAQAHIASNQNEHAALVSKAGAQIDQYRVSALPGILDRRQDERLWQIVRQVEGIASLSHDSNVWTYLDLSASQLHSISAVCEAHAEERRDAIYRLGRQMVAGLSREETLEAREREINQLSRRVRALDADLDKRLSDLLNSDQRKKWNTLLGSPLQIRWEKGGPPLLMYY